MMTIFNRIIQLYATYHKVPTAKSILRNVQRIFRGPEANKGVGFERHSAETSLAHRCRCQICQQYYFKASEIGF